jgi:hypothetical protein
MTGSNSFAIGSIKNNFHLNHQIFRAGRGCGRMDYDHCSYDVFRDLKSKQSWFLGAADKKA